MTTKHKSFMYGKCTTIFLLITLILILLLSSCEFPPNSEPRYPNQSSNNQSDNKDLVEIKFILQLPVMVPQDQRIGLQILDEVTGLSNNIRQFEMTTVNGDQYAVNLALTPGSVLKYRYVKIGETSIPEVTGVEDPVRYRLYHVNNKSSVTDILHAWQGESTTSLTGTLSGTLSEGESGQSIPDVLVSVGGQLTFTDSTGRFFIDKLTPGVHNVVFYAPDGKYTTYQQGANIAPGINTSANVILQSMPLVNVTFQVSGPSDALGAPIYLAGNIAQLGNTFTNLSGGMSIQPKSMPQLTPQEDGSYIINLQLYAELDLRYKFTLGDGYWNAEQQADGGFNIRQLIVPHHDLIINLNIESWRSPGIDPITFEVAIPPDTAPYDEKYIQFKTTQRTGSIPLWPLGNGNYLYILFSPLNESQSISYRFCRNADCEFSKSTLYAQIHPTDSKQTIIDTVSSWENWYVNELSTEIVLSNIPLKPDNYMTSIELTPNMEPSWQHYALSGISNIIEAGARNVIYSPQWFVQTDSPSILPEIGSTPFYDDLFSLLTSTQSLGVSTSIFPQLGPSSDIETWWLSQMHSEDWWDQWFTAYERYILNYAKLANNTNASSLILGGKSFLPAISGGTFPNGAETDVPDSFAERWSTLIVEVRDIYNGKLVWATNANLELDPLPEFIEEFDEIYILVDSPLDQNPNPTFEEISNNFNHLIDNFIYEAHRSTLKPVSLGLAYPSADGGALGCHLVSNDCYNDGLFLPDEVSENLIDLNEQTLIYNAVMPIIASRDWISGVTIRGFNPAVIRLDTSSSLFGKPSWDVIQYWFSGLTTH